MLKFVGEIASGSFITLEMKIQVKRIALWEAVFQSVYYD